MFKTTMTTALLCGTIWATPALAYPYVYVPDANAGTVTVVDAASNTIVRAIPNLPGAQGIAISPDGSRIYVAGGTSGAVTVLGQAQIGNPGQNPVLGAFTGLGNPVAVALSADGSLLFVADAQGNQVLAIDTSTQAVKSSYPAAGSGLSALALDPAGRRLALASGSGSSGTVRLYTLDNGDSVDIALQATPEALAFSNDGATLWITTASGLVAYDLTTGKQTTAAIAGGGDAIACSAREQAVYVAARNNATVYVYPATGGAPATISLGGIPTGLALSPDGTRAYATLSSGLDVIDTGTKQVVKTVSFGQNQAVAGDFVGPGNIWAENTVISSSVGKQISGTVVASDFLSRPLSFDLIKEPASGTLNFTRSTGDYTYTPPAGSSGVASFVWEATATSGVGSPTVPASDPITTTLLIEPTLSAFNAQEADAGAGVDPLDFTLQGSMPLAVTVSSTNKQVIDPANAQLSSGCGSTSLDCTLTLTAGSAKGQTATVTVTATDPSGAAAQQTFSVSINGSGGGGGGGGGGSLSWLLLTLLAGLAILVSLHQRRQHESI
ncbi:MAG: YncE family protein [Gammaproteobacteria bacterium]